MRLFITAAMGLISLTLFAETPPVYQTPFQECFQSDKYISGEECYKTYNKTNYPTSEWNFLEVPIQYDQPNSGRTKISYRLSPGFSIDKKTIIYFNGGPGGTSYVTDFNQLEDVNVIYFNQRGSAFSRPESKELFLNQDYYSSENTAHDAFEIVKHLGVNQVTAYGVSYGTIPATIFGSLFPQYTRNVILEGVIYDGEVRLWTAHHRVKLVQKYFDGLSFELKENILKYSRHPEVFAGWFTVMAQRFMYDANFEFVMTDQLNRTFNQMSQTPEEKEKFIVDSLRSYNFTDPSSLGDMIYYSATMFTFIGCKELNAANELSSFYSVFDEKNKLVPYKKTSSNINFCEKLNVEKAKTYSSKNYPVDVPVYYFQGTTDGATTADFAVWHYKDTAKGKAQIVLAKKMGHAVMHLQKFEGQPDDEKKSAIQKESVVIFKAAINNEELNLTTINHLIGDKKSWWVKTSK